MGFMTKIWRSLGQKELNKRENSVDFAPEPDSMNTSNNPRPAESGEIVNVLSGFFTSRLAK